MPTPAIHSRIVYSVCVTLLLKFGPGCALGQAKPADAAAYENNVRSQQQLSFSQGNIVTTFDFDRLSVAEQRWQQEEDAVRRGEIAASGLIIFPPFPTALAASIKAKDGLFYPEILADYAGEPFFMPYGSLRLRDLIFSRRLRRIEDYRTARDKLVRELRDTLARTRDKSGTAQLEALSLLAQAQEKRLAALETDAETIRIDLTTSTAPISGSLLGTDAIRDQPFDAGAALISAREKVKSGKQPGLKNYLTALLAAQFEPGLSLDQRLMFQEIAADSLVAAPTAPGSGAAELYFFLPGSARMRWPERTNPDLAKKFEIFEEKRAALKRELVVAVTGIPGDRPDSKHSKKYADLAKAQAPRFAELESLAEEIRTALAGLPYPDEPAPSNLPADLTNRMGHMLDTKTALLREVQRAGKEFGGELAPERVEVVYQNNTATLALPPPADPAAPAKKDRAAILARLQKSNDEFKRRFADLGVEMNAVRAELQRYHDSLRGDQVPDLGRLSIEFAKAYTLQQNWNRYRDYRDAVLTPGLSPAQRRLLFNAAVADLEKYRLSIAN